MLRLLRDSATADGLGIFGTLFNSQGEILCETLELQWAQNKQSISCIPRGSYECFITFSQKLGRVIAVKDVPGRTDILFHPGNSVTDTRGCILPGRERWHNSVRQSRLALGQLILDLPDEFKLEVTGLV